MNKYLFFTLFIFLSGCVQVGDAVDKSPAAQGALLLIFLIIPAVMMFGVIIKYIWEEFKK